MRPRLFPAFLAAGVGLALLAPAARAQDEVPIYKKLSPRQLEKVLRDLGYEFVTVSEMLATSRSGS